MAEDRLFIVGTSLISYFRRPEERFLSFKREIIPGSTVPYWYERRRDKIIDAETWQPVKDKETREKLEALYASFPDHTTLTTKKNA